MSQLTSKPKMDAATIVFLAAFVAIVVFVLYVGFTAVNTVQVANKAIETVISEENVDAAKKLFDGAVDKIKEFTK